MPRGSRVPAGAASLRIDPEASLRICLKQILGAYYQSLQSLIGPSAEGTDAEALHDLRTNARRIQTLLQLFHSCFSGKKAGGQAQSIRSLIRAAGRVREMDVFLSLLKDRRGSFSGSDRSALDLIAARTLRRQTDERRRLVRRLKRFESAQAGRDLRKFLASI